MRHFKGAISGSNFNVKRHWKITAVLLPLALAASVAFHLWWQARLDARIDLSRKLIGRWAAEGRADKLIAGSPAVLKGGVSRVPGHSGIAWSFDGATANVSVPDGPQLAFRAGQDFSVMAWIQPKHSSTSFNIMSIVEKRKVGGITTALGYSLHLDDGRLGCQISPSKGPQITKADLLAPSRWLTIWKNRNAPAAVNGFCSTGPDLRDGKFHHVALTMNRHSTTGGKLYVDGNVILTFDPTKVRGSLANSEPLLIATHPDTTLQCAFKGLIEDVRLYARTLSPAEIERAAKQ